MVAFTKTSIEKLEPKVARYDVYDRDNARSVPGLLVRVFPTGAKSFQVFRKLDGKPIRVTLGRFPGTTVEQARNGAIETLNTLKNKINPNEEKRSRRSKNITLRQALDDFCRDRRLKASTEEMYRGRVKQYLANWLDQPLSYVTRDRIARKHAQISKKSQTSANKVMRIIRGLFNYAAGEYLNELGHSRFPDNPVRQLSHKQIWHKERRRTNRLSADDLPAWFTAVHGLDAVWHDFFILVLLTGLRRREAQGLSWGEIDLQGKRFTVSGERTKNGHDHALPLSDFLFTLLESRRNEVAGQWVFPSATSKSGHIETPAKLVTKVREQSGTDFTIHDLRRTFASVAETLGISGYTLKRLLNHRTRSDVTTDYVVLPAEDLRNPMQRINDVILDAGNVNSTDALILDSYRPSG